MAFVPDAPAAPSKFVPDAAAAAPKPAPNAQKDPDFDEHGPLDDVVSMLKSVPAGVVQMLQGMGKTATEHPILGNIPALLDTIKRVASDPSGTLSSVGSALRNATPDQVGRNVVAPMVAGGVANEGVGLARGFGAGAAAEAATPAGQLGLRTAQSPGSLLAGDTAGPTMNAQNQRVASSVLGADAGVPHSSPVNPSTLATAREAPGRLLDNGYDLIPSGPLSPAARNQVAAARGPATITKPTPNITGQVDGIESSLLDPNGQFTGPQLRATRNSLNADANAGIDSTDPDTRTIAKYKRGVVSALDQHLADSLPAGSPVTPEMVQNARGTLAKNYTLQDLIGKGGDINLQGLAKMHRESPGLFTGNTGTVAQFASDHPEVTGNISNADRISPPSLATDLSTINVVNPRSWVQPLFGALGRRMLRGPSGEAIGSAMQAPVAGLGGEFNPLPMSGLSPPPGSVGSAPIQRGLPLEPGSGEVLHPTGGMTASTPTAPPPAGGAPPGSISLADLLSHGVEQGPSPGLSLAPEGGPAPQGGVPFQQNAEHMAGGLQVSPEDWLNKFLSGENNSDHAGVMSQGVPENIMTRAANNASGESAASQEAINRGTRALVTVDQDGNEAPVMRDVTQADRRAPTGKIIIDKSNGEIVDRGGMSQDRAQGLRNRWATVGRQLGDHFVMGRAGG